MPRLKKIGQLGVLSALALFIACPATRSADLSAADAVLLADNDEFRRVERERDREWQRDMKEQRRELRENDRERRKEMREDRRHGDRDGRHDYRQDRHDGPNHRPGLDQNHRRPDRPEMNRPDRPGNPPRGGRPGDGQSRLPRQYW